MTHRRFPQALLAAGMLAALATAPARAQDPGTAIPSSSEASDNKNGAVLFYNLYTSDLFDPSIEDTRLSITNGDPTNPRVVRLFLVQGSSGTPTSTFVCLAANQTVSLQASVLDIGVRGYAVAVAVDPTTGCPIGAEANVLSGQAHVELASGLSGTLPAVAVSALFGGSIAGCSGISVTANLPFNGVSYNGLPRMVSVDNIPSRADLRRTFLVVNRPTGNLAGTTAAIGKMVGGLYDDAENKSGYVIVNPTTQFAGELMNGLPLSAPPFETRIPAGRTGWMRLRSFGSDFPLLGAAFFEAPNGAINLRTSTLSSAGTLTMPVSAPNC